MNAKKSSNAETTIVAADEFIRNCNMHTLDALEPYQGQYVAWSADGQAILAHASTLEELYEEIRRRSLRGCVQSYIPRDEEIFLGGDERP